ncbi:MAG: type II toxin-antitoxin system RelE/ParE family toxin, partial [Deltaproteobacteria bacterium]|nr:type II toxin-antitoxin system RelE/ParE family toxin [Deltaproteobacteria bacterium]
AYFSAYEQKLILDEIKGQLADEPTVQTRNRKELRDNPVARWELRIGKYRAFYEVDVDTATVAIGAVGFKAHNILYIRGEEVAL